MSEATLANRRYQCRHIFTDGHRCGSPSLRNENFCYYHHATRRPKPAAELHDPYNYPPNQCPIALTLPEDRSAIQHSIGQIMKSLAENALDPRRAGLLLYALQIASMNLKNAPELRADEVVQDVTLDPIEGPLAPHNEVPGDELYREFLQSLEDADEEDEDQDEDLDDDEDEDLDDEEDIEEQDEAREGHRNGLTHPEREERQSKPELETAATQDHALDLQASAARNNSPAPTQREPGHPLPNSSHATKMALQKTRKLKGHGRSRRKKAARAYLKSALLEARIRPLAKPKA